MASFRHSVTIPRTPQDVFPWLLEEAKVPKWTGSLEAYEVLGAGPLGRGSRVRQILTVSGQRVELELEITRYEPPHEAESRFSISGLDVEVTYALTGADGSSELTQTLEGKASSFKTRMLLPVVQPRLERKLTEDLERLRALLSP